MYIQVQAGDEQVATYEILFMPLKEAVLNMNLAKPISLDRFLIRNSAFPTHVIPHATDGDILKLKLIFNEYEKDTYEPKLEYCSGVNFTKMLNEINWGSYFDLEGVTEPPSDEIRIFPKSESENECSVKIQPNLDPNLPLIYISYGAEISLKMVEKVGEGAKKILFRIDPLVKVSSNQGG